MCGIVGFTNINERELAKAREALHKVSHRGPDQWNDWHNKMVYLGQRRLSIMDLSENGKQPMISEDEEVVVTVNGEIYNYLELKAELSKHHKFISNSDSEIVVHGFEEWGIENLLNKLEGMYALSIFHKKTGVIYLARDRVGIKPLFYSLIDKDLSWASELKVIKSYYNQKLKVDNTALYDFLTYLYIPTPKTLFKDVYKLQPASYLKYSIDTKRVEINRYWNLSLEEKSEC